MTDYKKEYFKLLRWLLYDSGKYTEHEISKFDDSTVKVIFDSVEPYLKVQRQMDSLKPCTDSRKRPTVKRIDWNNAFADYFQ